MSALEAMGAAGAKPKRRGVGSMYMIAGIPLGAGWTAMVWDAALAGNKTILAAFALGVATAFWIQGLRAK